MKRSLVFILVTLLTSSLYGACGGGSDDHIQDISEIPLSVMDPGDFDPSLVGYTPGAMVTRAAPGEVGGFSRASCETMHGRNAMVAAANATTAWQCFINKFAEAGGAQFGQDEYNYYNMGEFTSPGGDVTVSIKAALKRNRDGSVSIIGCINDEKAAELNISRNGDVYSGSVINMYGIGGNTNNVGLDFEVDGTELNFANAIFDMRYQYASDRMENYGTLSSSMTPDTMTIYGSYVTSVEASNFDVNTAFYAAYSATQGSAKYSTSGTYRSIDSTSQLTEGQISYIQAQIPDYDPETRTYGVCGDSDGNFAKTYTSPSEEAYVCAFDGVAGTESFSMSGTYPDTTYAIIESTEFLDAVNNATLPSMEGIPTVAFSSDDFSTCSDASMVDISALAAQADYSECTAYLSRDSDFNFSTLSENVCQSLEDLEWVSQ